MVIPQMLVKYVYVHYKCKCIIFLYQHEQSDLDHDIEEEDNDEDSPPLTVTTVSAIIISFRDSCVDVNLYEAFIWLIWSKASLNPFYTPTTLLDSRRISRILLVCGQKKSLRLCHYKLETIRH